MLHIYQSDLGKSISLFLTTLGDESLARFVRGLCNAFAFMNFRAHVIGEEDKNYHRMLRLMSQSDRDIVQLATLYNEYRNKRRSLVEETEGKDDLLELAQLNGYINKTYQDLTVVRENLTAVRNKLKKDKKKYQNNVQTLEYELQTLELEKRERDKKYNELRDNRNQLIEKKLRDVFDYLPTILIYEAEALYFYIHALVGAFAPGIYFDFHINGSYVNQNDFIAILKLFPPDVMLPKKREGEEINSTDEHEIKIPVKKVFEINFAFTEKEWVEVVINTIHDGDLIALFSSNHTIFLSNKNGIFILYDRPIEIGPNTAEALVAAIKECFFTSRNLSADYMPISVSVFAKGGDEKEKTSRPNAVTLIQTLLDKRESKNIDAKGWDNTTAAWIAAKTGDMAVIKFLIEEGADFNIPGNSGFTPLMIASQNGHAGVVKLLLDIVDVNKMSSNGATSLYIASQHGHASVVKLLLEKDTNLHAGIEASIQILKNRASEKNRLSLDTLLKDKGVMKEKLDQFSPLHAAACFGYVDVVKELLAAGANPLTAMEANITVMELAEVMGHSAIVNILKSYQAPPLAVAPSVTHQSVFKPSYLDDKSTEKSVKTLSHGKHKEF